MSLPTASVKRSLAARLAGLLMGILLMTGLQSTAGAGDEDISPNAYQEFDPVTGYMITVDPDAEQRQGHGADDDAGSGTPEAGADGSSAWVYWVVAGAVLAGGAVWLRSRLTGSGPR